MPKVKTKRVSITMPVETIEAVAQYAKNIGLTASEVYREGLRALNLDVPDVEVGNPYNGKPAEG